MEIIINADDFGASTKVNKEIERCIKEGLISSTTIMANGVSFEEVVSIAAQYPNISYGVHLALDEFDSITKSAILHKYELTDSNGKFIKGSIWRANYTNELKDAVYDEWKAQIGKIINSGIIISHIDGHHHCHTIFELFGVLKRISTEFGIYKVRQAYILPLTTGIIHFKNKIKTSKISNNNSLMKSNTNINLMSRILIMIKKYLWRMKAHKYFIITKRFYSLGYFFYINNKLNKNSYDTIELMCHPGNEMLDESKIINEAKLFDNLFFKLISYRDL